MTEPCHHDLDCVRRLLVLQFSIVLYVLGLFKDCLQKFRENSGIDVEGDYSCVLVNVAVEIP